MGECVEEGERKRQKDRERKKGEKHETERERERRRDGKERREAEGKTSLRHATNVIAVMVDERFTIEMGSRR